jgi:hypothetical protein
MMKKYLRYIPLVALFMLGTPVAHASNIEAVQAEQQIDDDLSISISGQTVTICGAQGATLEIVSLTGRKVMQAKIDSPAQRIELNIPKGCYILKVGKVARKITVK